MFFQVLKGASSRISMDVTPFHAGWCYYTSDDGKFYIDSQEEDGSQKRTCINAGTVKRVVELTLSVTGWKGNQQELIIDGLLKDQNGVIGTAQNLTEEQMDTVCNAGLQIGGQKDGVLTVVATKEIPARSIPVVLLLFS